MSRISPVLLDTGESHISKIGELGDVHIPWEWQSLTITESLLSAFNIKESRLPGAFDTRGGFKTGESRVPRCPKHRRVAFLRCFGNLVSFFLMLKNFPHPSISDRIPGVQSTGESISNSIGRYLRENSTKFQIVREGTSNGGTRRSCLTLLLLLSLG